jgi:hypothetical protein
VVEDLYLSCMKESEFVAVFQQAAAEIYGGKFVVRRGAALLYELLLGSSLEVLIKDTRRPKRGYSAFQTDLCIFEKRDGVEYPRVVIEFKTRITTHDIILYSSKAGKHKQIYPGLRYGLLASELEVIPDRFFIHNESIDFFIAAKKYKDRAVLKSMIEELVNTEVTASRRLEMINMGTEKFDYFRTDVVFRNFR